jgi:hypothetical protein
MAKKKEPKSKAPERFIEKPFCGRFLTEAELDELRRDRLEAHLLAQKILANIELPKI